MPRVVELVYTAWDIRVFAEGVWAEADEGLRAELLRRNAECNAGADPALFAPRDGFALPPYRWDEGRRALARAELDARIARLYGLTRDELRYILDPADVYGPDFPGGYRDEAHFARHVERRQREWAAFQATLADGEAFLFHEIYKHALATLPGLWERGLGERVSARRHITVTQGDCYLTQWLCPRVPGAAGAFLVDFDSVSANFAAYDLVYMLATFWTWAQRRDAGHELDALGLYHSALQAAGVAGYDWEQLCDDYALMLRLMIFDPVHDAVAGSPARYWQPKMTCLAPAYLEWCMSDDQ